MVCNCLWHRHRLEWSPKPNTLDQVRPLWIPPSHKHLYSTAPGANADFKESLVPNKFRPVSNSMDPFSSMHQSAAVSGALADFQESLMPNKLSRNNELVFSRNYETVIS